MTAEDESTHVIFKSLENPSTFIRISKHPTNFTLSEFTRQVEENILTNPDSKIMTTEDVSLSGLPGKRIDGFIMCFSPEPTSPCFNQPHRSLYIYDTWAIKDNIAYRVNSVIGIGEMQWGDPITTKLKYSMNNITDSFRILD